MIRDLRAFVQSADIYQRACAQYWENGFDRTIDRDDKENRLSSWEDEEYYFSIGAEAARICIEALINAGSSIPKTILDFPCGSGRVTRHLRAMFPEAKITASDLYEGHVDFCARTFDVHGLLSKEVISEVRLGEQCDLIFCGSLLTHLPEPLFHDAIDLFCRSLSPTGLAVVSLHGRYCDHMQEHLWKHISDDLYAVAKQGVDQHGFGYVDYEHGLKSLFSKQSSYGMALVRPSWVAQQIERRPDVRLISYRERDWNGHHDICVFGRPGVNDPT